MRAGMKGGKEGGTDDSKGKEKDIVRNSKKKV